MTSTIESRRGLTFAQAEGAADLPRQLSLREISQECSASLWAVIHDSFLKCVYHDSTGYGAQPFVISTWDKILKVWHVSYKHKFIYGYNSDYTKRMLALKSIITSKDYIIVFTFLQFLIQRSDCPDRLDVAIAAILERTRSAYRVIDKMIVPLASDEEADAVRRAVKVVAAAEAQGPCSQLRQAATALTAGDMAGCVRESISAVEGAAKAIAPGAANDTLGVALSKLTKTIGLNPAMASAFKALYGWTSSTEGIRHALVFPDLANVTERDAMFMFGACASFASYLLSAKAEISEG